MESQQGLQPLSPSKMIVADKDKMIATYVSNLKSNATTIESAIVARKPTPSFGTRSFLSHHTAPSEISLEEPATDTSVSSIYAHPFEPLSRCSDEETFDGTAPPLSSQKREDSMAGLTLSESRDSFCQQRAQQEAPPKKRHPHEISLSDDEQLQQRNSNPLLSLDQQFTHPGRNEELEEYIDSSEVIVTPAPTGGCGTDNGCYVEHAEKKAKIDSAVTLLPVPSTSTSHCPLLLAQDGDDAVLNTLHVFIRQQVEVFTATDVEIAQPAPGRKNPIKLRQVGLRCIHCRDLPPRDRVKRAVCYPTSVGRVYNSVSDMKFDHFNRCKGLSDDMRSQFDLLKGECAKKKTEKPLPTSKTRKGFSSTAQYYHDSARRMGMVDSGDGVYMAGTADMLGDVPSNAPLLLVPPSIAAEHAPSPVTTEPLPAVQQLQKLPHPRQDPSSSNDQQGVPSTTTTTCPLGAVQEGVYSSLPQHNPFLMEMYRQALFQNSITPFILSMVGKMPFNEETKQSSNDTTLMAGNITPQAAGVLRLSSDQDMDYLNDLHCFVRKHIEVFTAGKDDVTAPAPGRKQRIILGQVGIRCVHCARLPFKQRVKRAVCYPPSVSGIYHSVSNMKFDHFDICPALPAEDRVEFTRLRNSCKRVAGNPAIAKNKKNVAAMSSANSTSQYYHDAALRLGLLDTSQGIRFRTLTEGENKLSQPSSPSAPQHSESVTGAMDDSASLSSSTAAACNGASGISALMIAANDPKISAV